MPQAACPGSCNAAWRRAQSQPEPPEIQPWPGDPVWCFRDAAAIKAQLAELDDLASIHAAAADGHRGAAGEQQRVGGSRGSPSPSPIADDLDELAGWLRDWESAFRGSDPRPRRGYLATEITTIIAWLVAHFDSVIAHPDLAADFGQEVRRWHRELSAKTKAGTGKHHKPMPCSRCDTKMLTWREGEEYVVCENCGRLMSLDEYDSYATALAA